MSGAPQQTHAYPSDQNTLVTRYVNTIAPRDQPDYPGDLDVERRVEDLIRWNAMAMVVRANRGGLGLGGHISTYASAATLFEVALNHFLRAPRDDHLGDFAYFQGHASPGIYARAYLEGRLSRDQLERFRRECGEPGLSSYPHPRWMPAFWQFPTVSMGLSPMMAIYQARFLRYATRRKLLDARDSNVWCFIGDGECDEPEALAALSLAVREELDNLIVVVNCNLQRLDGPVRGNGKIIQELEALFRGAGWDCIKVLWSSDWDQLLADDDTGALAERMEQTVDGAYQRYTSAPGAVLRDEFFGASDELRAMVENMDDHQLEQLTTWGGHDPRKVYTAYQRAIVTEGVPVVILAKTVKGYGLGDAGEARNVTHQQKKLDEQRLLAFRDRFAVPIDDDAATAAQLVRPDDDSDVVSYILDRRRTLGGFVPNRFDEHVELQIPPLSSLERHLAGSDERPIATTMAFVRMLDDLMTEEDLGPRIVPIVPDEARTFGMDALFRKHAIYTARGQRYEPVDSDQLLYYREDRTGRILEEGITEAGAMSSFIAAGTAHSTCRTPMIPVFLFYSMFGFQRVGDLIWAAADARARGFLIGATAGRTTLAGEGLQHQDGHSLLTAACVPSVRAYDPAFAYELAIIVHNGLERMYRDGHDDIYYITAYNEPYPMPALPEAVTEGITAGLYRLSTTEGEPSRGHPSIMASGPIVNEAVEAQRLLAEEFLIGSDVWSVTSFSELRRGALAAERQRRLRPDQRVAASHLERATAGSPGPFILASDWVRLVPEQIARWLPGMVVSLGTDGFGRSDTRQTLRDRFEVDARHVAYTAIEALAEDGSVPRQEVADAMARLEIDPSRPDPADPEETP